MPATRSKSTTAPGAPYAKPAPASSAKLAAPAKPRTKAVAAPAPPPVMVKLRLFQGTENGGWLVPDDLTLVQRADSLRPAVAPLVSHLELEIISSDYADLAEELLGPADQREPREERERVDPYSHDYEPEGSDDDDDDDDDEDDEEEDEQVAQDHVRQHKISKTLTDGILAVVGGYPNLRSLRIGGTACSAAGQATGVLLAALVSRASSCKEVHLAVTQKDAKAGLKAKEWKNMETAWKEAGVKVHWAK
ncbi:hypothetical protein JCM10450v2_001770 [Rhodotorula kratochvilovae]